ncbi:[acyl-carrier-protein] S-malonyltransferase [Lachnospiraceae bacterium RM5]|nr:[acyl-carrier-protein] S-malonyltransferase [Lachnospiraceae bacterium RM5]
MGKIAFLFSGQGSQYPGMGKDFYENIPLIKEKFDKAEDFRNGSLNQMFNGTKEELKITKNTQPLLFLEDFAGALALKEKNIYPDVVAGFSLGEIVAITFAGILDYESGFKLVCKRGELMQKAAEVTKGKMIAVLRADADKLKKMCMDYNVYPVNYNCPGQIVVSGEEENIDKFMDYLKEEGIRCILLEVSGSFHTPYMESASSGLNEELRKKDYKVEMPKIPVYSNKTASIYPDDEEKIINLLSDQISNPVRWEDIIKKMFEDGVDTFIECGPGNVLSSFVKKILKGEKNIKILNVGDMESLECVLKEME